MPYVDATCESTNITPSIHLLVESQDGQVAKQEVTTNFNEYSINIPAGNKITGVQVFIYAGTNPVVDNSAFIRIDFGNGFSSYVEANEDYPGIGAPALRNHGTDTELWNLTANQINNPSSINWTNVKVQYTEGIETIVFYIDQLFLRVHYEELSTGTIKFSEGLVKLSQGRISL